MRVDFDESAKTHGGKLDQFVSKLGRIAILVFHIDDVFDFLEFLSNDAVRFVRVDERARVELLCSLELIDDFRESCR